MVVPNYDQEIEKTYHPENFEDDSLRCPNCGSDNLRPPSETNGEEYECKDCHLMSYLSEIIDGVHEIHREEGKGND